MLLLSKYHKLYVSNFEVTAVNAVTRVLQTAAFLKFAISTLHGHCTVSQYQTWVFVNFSIFAFSPVISLSP